MSLRIAALLLALAAAQARCRFALDHSCAAFHSAPSTAATFLHSYALAQAGFAADGIGLHAESGLTFDGHPLDFTTGLPTGAPHAFSAASKECIHVALLALAIRNSSIAQAALGDFSAALAMAERKLASYQRFNLTQPGYGCHLPWFLVPSLQPTADWVGRVPGLDNGELAWAVLALADALAAAGAAAAAGGWAAWFACMAASAPLMFHQGQGRVAAVVALRDATQPPSNNTYTPTGLLLDPYEGETMTVLLDLFGGLGAGERAQLWALKRPHLQPRTYTSPAAGGAQLTAQVGFWLSSHEQWKAALLPYLALRTPGRVLANTERARTWHSVDAQWPGLLASTNDLSSSSGGGGYVSAAGVQALGVQPGPYRVDVLAPYGAWVALLVNESVGACWLRNVLAAPRAQGPLGATEAVAANGSSIAALQTWDTGMTVVLAAAGGVGGLVGAVLQRLPQGPPPSPAWLAAAATPPAPGTSAMDVFNATLEREYAAQFPTVLGEGAGFGLPGVAIPSEALTPWAACE